MQIINLTKDHLLAENILLADNFLKRLKGLLGHKSFEANQAMILRPSNAVHTFFMRFPIDVLFVDRNNTVVKAVDNMRPFRATGVYLKSVLVIELPAGVINSTQTTEGDCLRIQ